jgi:hypothetical protein
MYRINAPNRSTPAKKTTSPVNRLDVTTNAKTVAKSASPANAADPANPLAADPISTAVMSCGLQMTPRME